MRYLREGTLSFFYFNLQYLARCLTCNEHSVISYLSATFFPLCPSLHCFPPLHHLLAGFWVFGLEFVASVYLSGNGDFFQPVLSTLALNFLELAYWMLVCLWWANPGIRSIFFSIFSLRSLMVSCLPPPQGVAIYFNISRVLGKLESYVIKASFLSKPTPESNIVGRELFYIETIGSHYLCCPL